MCASILAPQREVAFEVLEGFFDRDELRIIGPELGGVVLGEIGAQQIVSLAPAHDPQLVAIER